MRLISLFLLVSVLGLTACESDEKKLERLRLAEATSCLPVLRADSAEHAHDAATARLDELSQGSSPYGGGSASIALMQADIDESKKSIDELSAKIKQVQTHPKEYAAQQKAAASQRTKCDLAKRDVSRFMNGR
jgi:hypothetical protein